MDSTNPSLPSFKVKRDEYLVEIRKNKNVEQLKMKRQKLVNQALNLEKEINLKVSTLVFLTNFQGISTFRRNHKSFHRTI